MEYYAKSKEKELTLEEKHKIYNTYHTLIDNIADVLENGERIILEKSMDRRQLFFQYFYTRNYRL